MKLNMDSRLMNKILKEREVEFNDLPDGFDIESLPEDVEIIFRDEFPDMEDDFWEDEK